MTDTPNLASLCMHSYTTDTQVTPLLQILATGLDEYLQVNIRGFLFRVIWRTLYLLKFNFVTASVPNYREFRQEDFTFVNAW